MSSANDTIIREQLDYYRARAAEYDQWWLREGRYDRGSSDNELWFADSAAVAAALESFEPSGRILELACGTGIWSEKLLRHAESLTLVDGSAEMLKIAAQRLGSSTPRLIHADLFQWQPDEQYDTIFFSFWLSHIPPERFGEFWQLAAKCLAPGGRLLFIDSRHDDTSTAVDHHLPDATATTLRRRLNDGREFQIYKVFYDPKKLESDLSELGWDIQVSSTDRYFIYGHGERKVE